MHPTLHNGIFLVGGAVTGEGEGFITLGDLAHMNYQCADPQEIRRMKVERLLHGELLMACDSMEEIDYVEKEATRLESQAALEVEELEMKLTAAYLTAKKRNEQHETDRGWFEVGVQKYTDLVADRVAAGRVYTDNLANLAQISTKLVVSWCVFVAWAGAGQVMCFRVKFWRVVWSGLSGFHD